MFADFEDVQTAFEGVIPSSREDFVNSKIESAESLLVSLVPSLAGPDVSETRKARAKAMVCDAVLRVYRNPSGSTQESASYYSVSRSRATDSGLLYFPADELAAIRGTRRQRRCLLGRLALEFHRVAFDALACHGRNPPITPLMPPAPRRCEA